MTPLCAIAERYGTDKYNHHNYTPVYHHLFGQRRRSVTSVLEIGVQWGRSHRMWQDYFPLAMIYGIDVIQKRCLNEGRIASYCADQSDPQSIVRVARTIGKQFDLIVDDGSHKYQHQVSSMRSLLPYLNDDGVYVIEDIISVPGVHSDDPHNVFSQIPSGYHGRLLRTLPISSPFSNSDVMILIVHETNGVLDTLPC